MPLPDQFASLSTLERNLLCAAEDGKHISATEVLYLCSSIVDLRAERDRALEALREAREDFAELLRAHTRANWALGGKLDYPKAKRTVASRRGRVALTRLDAALDEHHNEEDDRG